MTRLELLELLSVKKPLGFDQLGGGSMATTASVIAPQRALEDPLAHLPCSTILAYTKGQNIYSQTPPRASLYLVIEGKVKVARTSADGRQVILDIYQTDEFF